MLQVATSFYKAFYEWPGAMTAYLSAPAKAVNLYSEYAYLKYDGEVLNMIPHQ